MHESITKDLFHRIVGEVEKVLKGKSEEIATAVTAFLAGGHCLVEDKPGVGKTVMARAIARTLQGQFRRIQFTSDMLPGDILGVQVYDAKKGEFRFHPGPIFANIVLADELNRANPRAQSAMLEAMTEGRVTMENHSYPLPAPFFVIATQNPIELHGAYPLPTSELDRFLVRMELGYPKADIEADIIRTGGFDTKVDELIQPVCTSEQIGAAAREMDEVKITAPLLDYVVAIGTEIRNSKEFHLGVSTRALIGLVRLARVWALTRDRRFCIPDDIKRFVKPALAHRLRSDTHQDVHGIEMFLDDLMNRIPVPA